MKKRNAKFGKITASILTILLLLSSILGIGVLSKYISKVDGEGTMKIAKWNVTKTLSEVARKSYTAESIAPSKIAPGTQGSFDVKVDATDTETELDYILEFSNIQNVPANMYFKIGTTEYANISDLTRALSGHINANDENKKIEKKVEWFWDYETTTSKDGTRTTLAENNTQDTNDGKSANNLSFDMKLKVVQGNNLEALLNSAISGRITYANTTNHSANISLFKTSLRSMPSRLATTSLMSNQDGTFTTYVTPDTYDLEATKDGYEDVTINDIAATTQGETVSLTSVEDVVEETPANPNVISAETGNGVYAKLYDTTGDSKGDTLVLNSSPTFEYRGTLITDYDNTDNKSLGYLKKWRNDYSTIQKVDIINEIKPTKTAGWFRVSTNLTEINNIKNLNISEVTDMKEMFSSCSKLTTLDVSSFDTSNVRDMSSMFNGCQKLMTLDLSSWNTSSVTNMATMFYNCSELTNLSINNFNTSNVTDMSGMFNGCKKLTNLNLNNFNTSSVTNMSGMFSSCSELQQLDVSNWNVGNVTNMSNMFGDCSQLTSLDVDDWNTSQVTNVRQMFYNCSELTNLSINNFNTSNVTDMSSTFNGCKKLMTLDVNNWNTNNVTSMSGMFYGCSNLTTLDLSNYNTENVTTMSGMFNKCSGLSSLNISSFNTSNVTIMADMFHDCSSLINLNISNFNTSKVTDMSHMFRDCKKIVELDLSRFNTESVTNMRLMFGGMNILNKIYVNNSFKVHNVTDSLSMFEECLNLVGGNGTTYNSSHIDKEYACIDTAGTPGYFTLKT